MPGGMPADMGDSGQKMPNLSEQISQMETLSSHMQELKESIPGAFETALKTYTDDIEKNREEIEEVFQKTLNEGFSDIYLLSVITASVAFLILLFYKKEKNK